jgi:hypothetical protein
VGIPRRSEDPPHIAASPQAFSNQLSAISYTSGMESSRAAKNLMDSNTIFF